MEQSYQNQTGTAKYNVTIYVAGPYSIGNIDYNVNRALKMCNELIDIGAAIFSPHLFHYLHLLRERSYEEWLSICFKWVGICDAFFRLDGYSSGADKEEAFAYDLGKPIFKDVKEVKKWLQPLLADQQ
jgi:hypothetical protein